MFLVALIGTMIHLLHRRERQNLHLAHEPGTIASAMSIGAQTHAADLLDGRQKESEFASALQNKKFRINPTNMKMCALVRSVVSRLELNFICAVLWKVRRDTNGRGLLIPGGRSLSC
jgi:hypothetical protein